MLARDVPCLALLVGPRLVPELTIDLARDELRIDGTTIRPTACFMRHDAFLGQSVAGGQAAALNWYLAVKGWELAHDEVRGFNKRAGGAENNKLQNLYLAEEVGLAIPPTVVTNAFARRPATLAGPLVQKPVAGGEFTTPLAGLRRVLKTAGPGPAARYPRFLQARLARPELRVYRVGAVFMSFLLHARDVDYRKRDRVRLECVTTPPAIEAKLSALTDRLGLDFAAADFMRDAGGAYRFLEVNTQPMFSAFDQASGGRLCDAIIDHLSAPTSSRRRAP